MFFSFVFSFALAAPANCDAPRDHREFYACSVEKHPLSKAASLGAREGDALAERAGQWRNPNLDARFLNGDGSSSTELGLTFPVSELWLRGPRAAVGEAERRLAALDAHASGTAVRTGLIRDLYRLQHLAHEREIVDETLRTYRTIRRQIQGRRARGPEQEVTLTLIELATGDYGRKRNRLDTEQLELLAGLRAIWGKDFEITPALLPPHRMSWPTVENASAAPPGLDVRRAIADAEKTAAEATLAQRESWPELKLGPVIERTEAGGASTTSTGLGVSLALPLFSRNAGGRRLADTRAEKARVLKEYARTRAALGADVQLRKYRSAVTSLEETATETDLRRKHDRVETLFKQGLLTGATVIEAHRQLFEYTVSQHEHEAAAVDAFIEIKTLRGEDFEEIIQ